MAHVEMPLCDILEYIQGMQPILKEGEDLFKEDSIIFCGLNPEDPNIVKSLCLETDKELTFAPFEITIKFDGGKKLNCQCSCKAGETAPCKHIVATLIYLNRNPNIEILSKTVIERKWGPEDFDIARPITECPCMMASKKYTRLKTSSEVDKRNFENLVSAADRNSPLATFLRNAGYKFPNQ